MNAGQLAVMKKDIRGITSNKRVFTMLLVVPLVLTILVPSIFIFTAAFTPDAASELQAMLDMLPAA